MDAAGQLETSGQRSAECFAQQRLSGETERELLDIVAEQQQKHEERIEWLLKQFEQRLVSALQVHFSHHCNHEPPMQGASSLHSLQEKGERAGSETPTSPGPQVLRHGYTMLSLFTESQSVKPMAASLLPPPSLASPCRLDGANPRGSMEESEQRMVSESEQHVKPSVPPPAAAEPPKVQDHRWPSKQSQSGTPLQHRKIPAPPGGPPSSSSSGNASHRAVQGTIQGGTSTPPVATTPPTIPAILETVLTPKVESLVQFPPAAFAKGTAAERFTHFVQKVVSHRLFDMTVAALILASAAVMGIQQDFAMRDPSNEATDALKTLDWLFLIAFSCELFLRVGAQGRFFLYLSNPMLSWNIFDSVIVLSTLVEVIIDPTQSDASLDLGVVRLLRVLRLVRILRIVRLMRFFRDLRVMVAQIMSSMKSLAFALVLLLLIMYVFAVCLLQMAAEERKEQAAGKGELGEEEYKNLKLFYGSLPEAVFTLYKSITNGIDWGEVAEPLSALNPVLTILFAGYIAFATLCVLNIVTGVFVETANKLTSQEEETMLLKEFSSRQEWLTGVHRLFHAQDDDGSGMVDWEEFQSHAQDIRVQAWFRKIGIDIEAESLRGLFGILDFDNDGSVCLEEFVGALQQIHGSARSIDMARLKYECRMIRRQLNSLVKWMRRESNNQKMALLTGSSANDRSGLFVDGERPTDDTSQDQPDARRSRNDKAAKMQDFVPPGGMDN